MCTAVVNLQTSPYDVYIGRGSIWGNPYSHKHGTKAQFVVATRAEAISKYEYYLRNNDYLLSQLHTLVGKRLGCYCKPKSCHGDILIKVMQSPNL